MTYSAFHLLFGNEAFVSQSLFAPDVGETIQFKYVPPILVDPYLDRYIELKSHARSLR